MSPMPLRVGVIGLGVGERHISGYGLDSRSRVVAVCDFDERKLKLVGSKYPELAQYIDPNLILNDPNIDVVSIASYDQYHSQQVISAVENGKHVFIEKPLCLYKNEFDAIKLALEKNPKVRLSSNLILRQEPRFQELHRRISAGELGELYYLEGDYDYGRLKKLTDSWRGQAPFYSVTHGGGIHLIDLVLWLSGQVPKEAFAIGSRICTQNTIFRYPDFVAALLKFESGLVAKITSNFGSVVPHGHKLCVYGTKGTFIHGHDGASYYFSRDPEVQQEVVKDSYPSANKGDMIPSFVEYICTGKKPSITEKEVFAAMETSISIEQSLENQQPVRIRGG